jgi:serine protease Do
MMQRFRNRLSLRAVAALAVAAGVAAPVPLASADLVTLKSGATIRGTILKRNDQKLWLDVGPSVLEFDVDDVRDVEAEVEPVAVEVESGALFRTAAALPSPDGYAITNAHVIQGETTLRATVWFREPDGTLRRTEIEDIEIIAVNNHLDLALLRITHPAGEAFDTAPLELDERIEVGQVVFAIGNPLGLERSLSQGVISTTQRSFDGLTYVQTDAAINPGNSGGPLFNTRGEVIGITNMGIPGGEALGFAIPTRYVKDFIRNREAFAFDKNNPNSGHRYHQPPPRASFGVAPQLRDGTSASGRTPQGS